MSQWGEPVISYEPFWNTLKNKKVSTYALIEKHGISSSLLTRIRRNEFISLRKIVDLCVILGCRIEDIVIYTHE